MPPGVDALQRLGLLEEVYQTGARPFRGLRLWNRDGVPAQASFPHPNGSPEIGLALSRTALDALLAKTVAAHPNVRLAEETLVTDLLVEAGRVVGARARRGKTEYEVGTPVTLAADGFPSRLAAGVGLKPWFSGRPRYGLSAHLEGVSGLGPWVEIYLGTGLEAYLAPLAGDRATLALLAEQATLMAGGGGRLPDRYLHLARSIPALAPRLSQVNLLDGPRATGPLTGRLTARGCPGLLLVGDACGPLDPISGQGISLALTEADLVARTAEELLAHPATARSILARYRKGLGHGRRQAARLTAALLWLSRHPGIADTLIARLGQENPLFRSWLAAACGRGHLSLPHPGDLLAPVRRDPTPLRPSPCSLSRD